MEPTWWRHRIPPDRQVHSTRKRCLRRSTTRRPTSRQRRLAALSGAMQYRAGRDKVLTDCTRWWRR